MAFRQPHAHDIPHLAHLAPYPQGAALAARGSGVCLLVTQLPDDYTTVLLNVMNDSPIRLKPGYTTNISLYYDIKGQRPYEYAHGVEILSIMRNHLAASTSCAWASIASTCSLLASRP